MSLKQKFAVYTFVRICKEEEMPYYMPTFRGGCDAIVGGTYAEKHYVSSERSFKQYSLYLIDEGKVTEDSSWYEEELLTALDFQNTYKAREMIEEYLCRGMDNSEE